MTRQRDLEEYLKFKKSYHENGYENTIKTFFPKTQEEQKQETQRPLLQQKETELSKTVEPMGLLERVGSFWQDKELPKPISPKMAYLEDNKNKFGDTLNIIGESENKYYYRDPKNQVQWIEKNSPDLKFGIAPSNVEKMKSDRLAQDQKLSQDYEKQAQSEFNNKGILRQLGDRTGMVGTKFLTGQDTFIPSTNNKVADVGTDIAGFLAGAGFNPESMGNSMLSASNKLGQKVLNSNLARKVLPNTDAIGRIANTALEGAITSVPLSLYSSAVEGDNLSDTLKRVGRDAATGLVMGGVLKGAGEGISKGREALGKATKDLRTPMSEIFSNPFKNISKDIKTPSDFPVIPSKNINPNDSIKNIVSNRMAQLDFNPNTKTEAPKIGSELLIEQPSINLPRFNEKSLNAEISAEVQPYIKPTTDTLKSETNPNSTGTKNRKFIENSFMNSEVPTPEMKTEMSQNIPKYERLTNTETWNKAQARVANNADEAINYFRGLDGIGKADDTALGQALISKAVNDGNYNLANELSIDLAEKLTKAGQGLQAASIFKRLTPDGMLMYANKTLEKVNSANFGKKGFSPIKLNDIESKMIVDNMTEINNINSKYENSNLIPIDLQLFASQKLAEIQKLIASKIPANLPEKLKAFQRINLLLNPKTMVRNTAGNLLTTGLENTKDFIGGIIDSGLSKITGKRAFLGTDLQSIKTQFGGAKRGLKEAYIDFKTGLDTSPSKTQYDLPTERTISPFGGYQGNNKIIKGLDNVAQKADEFTKFSLQAGDRPFYQAAYDDALRKQMKLSNVNVPTEEMKSFADQIAKERTFQDKNALTEAFSKLQNGLNKLGNAVTSRVGIDSPNFNLGNIALPFVKTPANILARALDYSPLQIKNVVQEALKGKNMDQYKFVDSLAKGLTGTALIGAGYMLAENGTITGKPSDDKDKREFDKNVGVLPYSINLGDKTYTYDWAQPASIPLAMGADIYNQLKQSKDPNMVLLEAGKSGVSTLFSQSLLQGVQKLFGGTTTSGNNPFIDNLVNTAMGSVQQFVPFGSALRQASEITDNVKRDTTDNSSVLNEKLINPIKSGIPGLRQSLPAKTDTFGKPTPSTGIIETLLSPGKIGYKSITPVQKELGRLFDQSGEKKQFPRAVDDKFTYKDKKSGQVKSLQLDTQEKNYYQRRMAEETQKLFNKKINSGSYKNLPDAKKADELSNAMEEANAKIKKDIFKKKGIVIKK